MIQGIPALMVSKSNFFCSRAILFFNQVELVEGVTLSATEKININSMFVSLGANGFIDLNDSSGASDNIYTMWVCIGSATNSYKYNALRPINDDAHFRWTPNGGGDTYSATGIMLSTGYIQTHIIPSSILLQNNVGLTVYSRTNLSSVASDIGCVDSNELSIFSKYIDGMAYYANNSTESSVSNSNSTGIYTSVRQTSTNQRLFRNEVKIKDDTNTSTGLPNIELFIASLSVNGTPFGSTTREYCFVSVHKGFSDSDTELFQNIINTAQTGLSRNTY